MIITTCWIFWMPAGVTCSTVGTAGAVMVHLAGGGGERLGVATGSTPQRAAVKATLQALMRLDQLVLGLVGLKRVPKDVTDDPTLQVYMAPLLSSPDSQRASK